MRLRHPLFLAALGASALLLSACGGAGAGTGNADSTTVTVETPAGATIQMPADPQAALGFYTTDVDMLVTLGFTLAGTQPVRDDYVTFPSFFPQEELEGLKTFGNFPEFNLEKVLEVGPDFILNGLGYEEDLDADLQKIAPTYTYNAFVGGDWRDNFAQLASDLGREAQYDAWKSGYDERVAEIRAQLDEKGIDPVVADVSIYDGQVGTSCYGVPCLVLADLGLQLSPLMQADEHGLPIVADGTTFSMEQLGDLDIVDVVFTPVNADGSGLITEDEALVSNALWNDLPFVSEGEVYGFDYEMYYGSPSGQSAFLEIVAKALLG